MVNPLVGRRFFISFAWVEIGIPLGFALKISMEEIDNMWQRLSLNEIEGDRFNFGLTS